MGSRALANDIQEIKDCVKAITSDLEAAKKTRREDSTMIKQLVTKMDKMEKIMQEKDDKIKHLESRVEDLEQYTRKEDIIITGLKIQRPFAEVVRGESEFNMDRNGYNSVENQVMDTLNSNGINIADHEISACHTLGKRNDDGKQNVIVRFVSRKSKVRTLINARKLKGTGIYINEHLTKKNADLAKAARDLRRAEKIQNTWIRDCKVFVKDHESKVSMVRDHADLSQF